MKKKLNISKESIYVLAGICVCLFSLIIVFSNKSVFNFLSIGILGAFGFVGFWILVPILFAWGIYLIFRNNLQKYRIGISIWGLFVIFFALLILFSAFGSEGQKVVNSEGKNVVISMFKSGTVNINDEEYIYERLLFNNSVDYLNQIALNFAEANGLIQEGKDTSLAGFVINNPNLGGGFVGYVLCGMLNNSITPVGTMIFAWLLILVGLLMVFNQQIKKLLAYIKGNKRRKEAIEDVHNSSVSTQEEGLLIEDKNDDVIDLIPAVNKEEEKEPNININELTVSSFNTTHGLKRPIFSLDGSDTSKFVQPEERTLYQSNPYVEKVNEKEVEETLKEPIYEAEEASDNNFVQEEMESEKLFKEENSPEEQNVNKQPQEDAKKIDEVDLSNVHIDTISDPLHRPQPKAVVKPLYKLPPLELLDLHENLDDLTKNDQSCQQRVENLNSIFRDLNIGAECISYKTGPSVTRYNISTKSNVTVSNIKRVVEDISIRLGGVPFRFEPIVFGETTSGIEIQNEIRINVGLRETLACLPQGEKYRYVIPFGKGISGNLLYESVTKFPHLLVAGTTGSGKSIFMHSCILSLLMRTTPYELKLLLIDPKKVEMSYYKDVPHLLCPIVNQPRKALVALRKLVDEMERRYNLFESNGTRDIKDFNELAKEKGIEPLPIIAVFIDEYADLTDEVKEIREPVVRIAQKARGAGIHMIVATQRPSVNVIDGVIKANLSSRVALMVGSYVDSNTIIGEGGAEKLLGNGDMIVDCTSVTHGSKPRVQGCFVTSSEINRVADYIRKQAQPMYDPEFLDLTDHSQDFAPSEEGVSVDIASLKEATEEQLYEQIKSDLTSKEYCSISYIQRTYGVGFPKAGRLFAKLQAQGLVARQGDSRGNKVLIKNEQSESPTSIDESTLYESDEDESSEKN